MSAPLLGLPPCMVRTCDLCHRTMGEPGMGWVSKGIGCAVCSPEKLALVMQLAQQQSSGKAAS